MTEESRKINRRGGGSVGTWIYYMSCPPRIITILL